LAPKLDAALAMEEGSIADEADYCWLAVHFQMNRSSYEEVFTHCNLVQRDTN
jgi:hypothetical protein